MTGTISSTARVLVGILLWITPALHADAQTADTRATAPPQSVADPGFPDDPDFDALKSAYEFGRYEDALTRARARLDRGGLQTQQLVALHKYAALSAFNLGKEEDAQRHFVAILQLQPDFSLDPFSVAPPAIALFETLRKQLEPQLEIVRQQQRVEAERRQRDAEDRMRRQRDDEERRRRLEDLSRRVTVRNVEKKSFLVNFVPFGGGQFQQDRTAAGVVLAVGEGAMAVTSVVAYFVLQSMAKEYSVTIDTPDGPRKVTRWGISPDRQAERDTWRVVKYASAGAFYTLYGYGVVDAIYHHEDESVTTTILQLPPDIEPRVPPRVRPAEPAPNTPDEPAGPEKQDTVPLGPGVRGQSDSPPSTSSPRASSAERVDARYFLFPTSSGLGAGFSLRF